MSKTRMYAPVAFQYVSQTLCPAVMPGIKQPEEHLKQEAIILRLKEDTEGVEANWVTARVRGKERCSN